MKRSLVPMLLLAAAAGCSKKQKAEAMEPTTTVSPGPAAETATPAAETASVPVSQNLSVSQDILGACGITSTTSLPPEFAYDKTELTAEDRAVLEKVATCLTTGPLQGRGLEMVGRADPRGTEEYNLGLGARRATTVSDYLARLGVKEPQLTSTTRGDLDATGTDDASWSKDRRVDLTLTK
ncbi:MAG: OmpA family protein [Kofleriaceae bacterium]